MRGRVIHAAIVDIGEEVVFHSLLFPFIKSLAGFLSPAPQAFPHAACAAENYYFADADLLFSWFHKIAAAVELVFFDYMHITRLLYQLFRASTASRNASCAVEFRLLAIIAFHSHDSGAAAYGCQEHNITVLRFHSIEPPSISNIICFSPLAELEPRADSYDAAATYRCGAGRLVLARW